MKAPHLTPKTGKLVNCYIGDIVINNAFYLHSNNFLITTATGKERNLTFKKLNIFDNTAKDLDYLNNVLKKKKNDFWLYEGFFFADSKGDLYYLTIYSNDIIKFDLKGNVNYYKKLIHETPLIQIREVENYLEPAKNDYPSVLSATADSNHIYILSNVNNKNQKIGNKNQRFLDIYDTRNGNYIYTYILPNNNDNLPLEIAVNERSIFILYEDNSICSYKMQSNDSVPDY